MTWYELWLFLHVAAVILWVGGGATAQVLGYLTQRAAEPAQATAFGRNMALVGTRVFLPSMLVVLVTGILLTEDGDWPWSEPFVYLGLVGWVLVAAAFGYTGRAAGASGRRLAAEGPNPALLANMKRLVLVSRLLVLVLFIVVFLMTVKPGTA